MTKQALKNLAKNAVKEVKVNLTKMLEKRKVFKLFEKVEDKTINVKNLKEAAKIKSEIDVLSAKVSNLQAQYKPLREEILSSLPGEPKDKVDLTIEGIHIKKYPKISGGNKIDQAAFLELARKKRILQMTTKKVTVVDEEAVLGAISQGYLTYEELLTCIPEGKVTENLTLDILYSEEEEQQPEETQEEKAAN
ncbi:gp518 [Bacillus phage G]|uniref:Gp518 n=1 Tax=Bacillus phage G TaxID=2884420 RepID=G3MAQ9_9CAUD|nr:gp518 [Bacillus phage G]AEO93776.1 gp518 [Bacillus phage G]